MPLTGGLHDSPFRGNPIHTVGELPAVGEPAPAVHPLTGSDLGDVSKDTYAGQPVVLNIFPSIGTQVYAQRALFNERVADSGVAVLCVSEDLPFASAFCGAEGIENVKPASAFRSSFGGDYGVTITDGPLAGLSPARWLSSMAPATSPPPSWFRRSPRSPTTTPPSARSPPSADPTRSARRRAAGCGRRDAP